jgi:peptidoglycan/LPS O-acetylase OafA/YrhL
MQTTERLHALDAVRAFALLLGVFFHAAISFIASFTEGLKWAVVDNSQSMVLIVFVGVSHVFRMSLFFFIAGYFAHLVYHRKGAAEFLRNRLMRIALPFVVGWTVIAPTIAAIWYWGNKKLSGLPILDYIWPSLSEWQTGEISLTHLWFLYYLMLVYILAVGARHLLVDRIDKNSALRNAIDKRLQRLVDSRWAGVVLSLPLAIAAIFAPHWNAGTGMPTPDHSLFPEMIPLVNYGFAFATGWVFHRNPLLLQMFTTQVKFNLGMSLVSLLLMSGMAALLATQTYLPAAPLRFVTGVVATMTMWYFNFALIGYALKRFAQPSPTVRYVADASYWIYIAHLPVVCALQIWVAEWPLHWIIKFPFIVAVAFVTLFASYHYFVRFTFIGAVLNGRKHRDPTAESALAAR